MKDDKKMAKPCGYCGSVWGGDDPQGHSKPICKGCQEFRAMAALNALGPDMIVAAIIVTHGAMGSGNRLKVSAKNAWAAAQELLELSNTKAEGKL